MAYVKFEVASGVYEFGEARYHQLEIATLPGEPHLEKSFATFFGGVENFDHL